MKSREGTNLSVQTTKRRPLCGVNTCKLRQIRVSDTRFLAHLSVGFWVPHHGAYVRIGLDAHASLDSCLSMLVVITCVTGMMPRWCLCAMCIGARPPKEEADPTVAGRRGADSLPKFGFTFAGAPLMPVTLRSTRPICLSQERTFP
eukprot:5098266-Pleurochrysis_carterae.AAC.1